jgi:translation initiation factor 6 (eIF-6)
MHTEWIIFGLIAALVVTLLLSGRKAQKEWRKNFGLAKARVAELGFKMAALGENILIEDGVVILMNDDDLSDNVEEDLASFETTNFGSEIVLYVHKSGNLAFITTLKAAKVSRFVYEK